MLGALVLPQLYPILPTQHARAPTMNRVEVQLVVSTTTVCSVARKVRCAVEQETSLRAVLPMPCAVGILIIAITSFAAQTRQLAAEVSAVRQLYLLWELPKVWGNNGNVGELGSSFGVFWRFWSPLYINAHDYSTTTKLCLTKCFTLYSLSKFNDQNALLLCKCTDCHNVVLYCKDNNTPKPLQCSPTSTELSTRPSSSPKTTSSRDAERVVSPLASSSASSISSLTRQQY